MSLGEHYLRLMNLANQAHDRETYHYFVNQAQKLLQDNSASMNQSLSLISSDVQASEQEAA